MAEYIEREAAEKILYDGCHTSNGREGPDDVVELWHMVQAIPAADVAPVRHGRWTDKRTIEHDGEWYCTECNKEITIYMGPDRKDRYAYCPNCGAKMGGDE